MSFIKETIRCKLCRFEMNISLGTFGLGSPKECPVCKCDMFEHVEYDWVAKGHEGRL